MKAQSAVFLTLLLSSTALAQDGLDLSAERGAYGHAELSGGFTPDPRRFDIVSGGPLDAGALGLGPSCVGAVASEPDFVLDYDDVAPFLRFFVISRGDTTLVVREPGGDFHCNDDSHGSENPTVDLRRPEEGRYLVWVGSYRAEDTHEGTLSITEMRSEHP